MIDDEIIEVSPRIGTFMRNHEMTDFREFTNYTEVYLRHSRNFGRKSVNEVKEKLAEKGLQLKPWPSKPKPQPKPPKITLTVDSFADLLADKVVERLNHKEERKWWKLW